MQKSSMKVLPSNLLLYVNTLMFISLSTVILFVCRSACLCFYDLNMIIDVSLSICGAQLNLSPSLFCIQVSVPSRSR